MTGPVDNTPDGRVRMGGGEDPIRRFFLWIGEAHRHDAVMLLEQSRSPSHDRLAMAVAQELTHQPLRAVQHGLTGLQALALAVTLLDGDAISHHIDPDDHEQVAAAVAHAGRSRIRGVFGTFQQAAFATVRQLGGAARFGIPASTEAELGDATRDAGQATLDEVELLAATNHGWYIRHAYDLGFVVFRTHDN